MYAVSILLFIGILAFIGGYFIGWNDLKEFLDLFNKKTPGEPEIKDYFILIDSMLSIYFTSSMIISFFLVSLSNFYIEFFEKGQARLFDAIIKSLKRIWVIIQFSVLNAIFNVFKEGKNEKRWSASKLVQNLVGLAWALGTFFVPPIIACENLGLFGSIKRSAALMKNTFGETAVPMFGFRFLIILTIIFVPINGILFSVLFLPTHLFPFPVDSILLFGPAVFLTTFALCILSTVLGIFKTAVYAYATGRPIGLFPEGLIKNSFKIR